MKNSKFRSLIENEIKEKGSYDVLNDSDFSMLVKETVIEKTTDKKKARFIWLDKEGCILTECMEENYTASTLPRIGKITIQDKRAQYLKDYAKTMTQFNLRFTKHDADVIEALKAQPNKQAYIKELIRKDLNRKKEGN